MKLKKKLVFLSVLVMMFVLSACGKGSDTNVNKNVNKGIDLSLNVKKGDKYNIHILNEDVTSVVATAVIPSVKEIKLTKIADMNLAVDVKDVDNDNNITLYYKYDDIKMSTEINGQKKEYDSKNNDNSTDGRIYKGIVGKGFTVKLDKKGKILDVKGMDEILNSVVDNISVNNQQKEEMRKALKFNFGDEAIKTLVKQTMSYYPQNNIKAGDTWESKSDIKTSLPISINNKWKFTGEKDGLLNLESQATVIGDTKNEPIDFMNLKANVKLNGDSKANMSISKDNGFTQKGTITQNMNGNIELLDSNLTPKNIKLPTKMTLKATYEITKK